MRTGTFALAACTVLISSTALAQNLGERIHHVMQQRATAQATNTSRAAMLGKLLYSDISVQFNETPARDAIKHIATVLNLNIVGRYNDDKTGTGIDPNAPITLEAQSQPALTVLEMVLEQCQEIEPCTWQLRDGFVEVGTKERLAAPSAREIRYYPIRDLLFEVPNFDNAPTLNLDSALNQGNQGGGGGGGGGRGGGGGGGGFGGGGGGRGGGGSGGGSIFQGGSQAEGIERMTEAERAEQIIDIITESIEPDAWESKGGSWATIRYYQGVFIVRAPDFVQRQVGGYPFAIRSAAVNQQMTVADSRYVTFSGVLSNVQITGKRAIAIPGGAAGGAGGAGSGGAGGAGGEGAPGGAGAGGVGGAGGAAGGGNGANGGDAHGEPGAPGKPGGE